MSTPSSDLHPLCTLFSAMSREELAFLADDIGRNGVREPVITFGGKILDGRHRVEAAGMAGVGNIPTQEFSGTEAEAILFVLSRNIARRHLNASQRAMTAARMLEMAEADKTFAEVIETHREALIELIERKRRHVNQVWPPKDGFRPEDPETLKAFARAQGVENRALMHIDDFGEFSNEKAWQEAHDLGVADTIPKDEPGTSAVEWSGNTRDKPSRKPDLSGAEAVKAEVSETQPPSVMNLLGRKASKDFSAGAGKPGRPPKVVSEIEAVAAMQGVSRKSVERARNVIKHGSPELTAAVDAGQIDVAKAERKVRGSPRAAPTKSRVSRFLSELSVLSDTPADFVKSATPEELLALGKGLATAADALRKYQEQTE